MATSIRAKHHARQTETPTWPRSASRLVSASDEDAFAALEPFIEGEAHCIPFRELGQRIGQTEAGARVTVFRLRQRFRELLTQAVRQTVETPGEVDEELAWVMGVLSEGQRA